MITTVEQLVALPAGTVLREDGGAVYKWKAHALRSTEGDVVWDAALADRLPLTVLYRPDLPSQDTLHAAVQAALDLHVAGATNGGYRYCVTCESEESAQPYPCPTRRALDTTTPGETP